MQRDEGPTRGRDAQGADAQDYEKAAGLRDLIKDLARTTKKEKSFERLPYSLPMALDPERDLVELAKVLNLPTPPQRIEGFDISNISGTFAVASLVSFKQGRPDRRTIAASKSNRSKARTTSRAWRKSCGGDTRVS